MADTKESLEAGLAHGVAMANIKLAGSDFPEGTYFTSPVSYRRDLLLGKVSNRDDTTDLSELEKLQYIDSLKYGQIIWDERGFACLAKWNFENSQMNADMLLKLLKENSNDIKKGFTHTYPFHEVRSFVSLSDPTGKAFSITIEYPEHKKEAGMFLLKKSNEEVAAAAAGGRSENNEALHMAAHNGSLKVVEELLNLVAEPQEVNAGAGQDAAVPLLHSYANNAASNPTVNTNTDNPVSPTDTENRSAMGAGAGSH